MGLFDQFLQSRGYTDEFLADIDNPAHPELKDLRVLASLLKERLDDRSEVVIIPDFDMDGIMSGIVAYAALSDCGMNVHLYEPDPKDGYGFDENDVMSILEQWPACRTIVTCDVGISCFSGIDFCENNGITVLVTDHHKEPACRPAGLTPATAVIDPMRLDETYPHPAICGAHVMQQLVEFFADTYVPDASDLVRRLRVFSGIGTISDMMPVLYENRVLIRESLEIARDVWMRQPTEPGMIGLALSGLSEVLNYLSSHGKISGPESFTEELYGFYLAPMFNSIKRMDEDIWRAFSIFFLGDTENIAFLYDLNERRKREVARFYDMLGSSEQPFAPFIYTSPAPAGILGLLATRVMKETGLPVVVVNEESLRGSGRSPEWFPFNTIMNSYDSGMTVAGHEGAFGVLSIDLEKSFSALGELVEARRPSSGELTGRADVTLDECPSVNDVSDFLQKCDRLRPFGRGFEKPTIDYSFDPTLATVRTMGQNSQHVKAETIDGLTVIWWNTPQMVERLAEETGTLTVRGDVSINTFRGQKTVQFISR